MKVTVHYVHDQLEGREIVLGVNEAGYRKAMSFLDTYQEYRGGERFEYYAIEKDIEFQWDMNLDEFNHLIRHQNGDKEYKDSWCYDGAMFFGEMKLEFHVNGECRYFVLFRLGVKDELNDYYLDDGTPYNEEFAEEYFVYHQRRTFWKFAECIEMQAIDILNKYPHMIESALQKTDPKRWYPGEKIKWNKDIVRCS